MQFHIRQDLAVEQTEYSSKDKENLMDDNVKIDFVMPWVDGGDIEWQKQRSIYAGESFSFNESQYRDWGILKYWFRCVEKYAPWVNKVHFVTCGQIPEWLNTEHPKLHFVNHTEFIPKEYLPTFSSHAIELNFHRIPELAELFVYFNDDMYVNAPVTPSDFFVNGYPCESPIFSSLSPSVIGDPFVHYLCNDISLTNKYFDKRTVVNAAKGKWFFLGYGKYLLKNLYFYPMGKFSAFHNFHIASSMRKSTYEEVWNLEPDLLSKTCYHKFRKLTDVNQYVMSYYNICKGEFEPRRADFGKFYTIGQDDQMLYSDLLSGKHKLICINDNPNDIENVVQKRDTLIQYFNQKMPEKSAFEL